jgi:hypothetical protein
MELSDDMRRELKQLIHTTLHRARSHGVNPRAHWVVLSPLELEESHIQVGHRKIPLIYDSNIQWIDGTSSFYVIRQRDYTQMRRDNA